MRIHSHAPCVGGWGRGKRRGEGSGGKERQSFGHAPIAG